MTHNWHISYPVLGLMLGTVAVLALIVWWCNRAKKRDQEAHRIIRDDIMNNTTFIPLQSHTDNGMGLGLDLGSDSDLELLRDQELPSFQQGHQQG